MLTYTATYTELYQPERSTFWLFLLQGEHASKMKAEDLRECKARYRELYSELQAVKSTQDHAAQLCEECKGEIVRDFHAWYLSKYGIALPPESPSLASSPTAASKAASKARGSTGNASAARKPASAPAPLDYNPVTKSFYDAQRRMGQGSPQGGKKTAPKQLGMGVGAEGRSKGEFTMHTSARPPGVF